MKLGTIYLATNKLNGMKYVGQTARDIWTRWAEHCRSLNMTPLHQAIREVGHNNFTLEELEKVPLEELDNRERYWIAKLDTFNSGYNSTLGGSGIKTYPYIRIVENGFIIESATELGRMMEKETGWKADFVRDQLKKSIRTGESFLEYHFEDIVTDFDLTPEDDVIDWIRTLSIRFCGKHIYCNELDMHFETIASCARYLLENGLYVTQSRMPVQALVTAIGKQLHGTTTHIEAVNGPLTFNFMPGTTKQVGMIENVAKAVKVYCPQIDKTFNSQIEAAKYFVENGIWPRIKVKTAKLRISNVINGDFQDYRGYTFTKVEE